MSTQSILEQSKQRYFNETDENLLRLNTSYFAHKNFLLGESPDRDKIKHYMLFHRILCTNNCEITNYIQDKIEGKLEEKERKPKAIKRVSEILRLAQQYLKDQDCTLEEALECSVSWSEASW